MPARPFLRSGEGLDQENEVTGEVIDAALEVHRELGPGLLESAYVNCLVAELEERRLDVDREVPVPVIYKGEPRGEGYRADLLVEGMVVVEAKTVDELHPIHEAQLLTYLRLLGLKVGLLVNFNVRLLRDGIVRRVLSSQ